MNRIDYDGGRIDVEGGKLFAMMFKGVVHKGLSFVERRERRR